MAARNARSGTAAFSAPEVVEEAEVLPLGAGEGALTGDAAGALTGALEGAGAGTAAVRQGQERHDMSEEGTLTRAEFECIGQKLNGRHCTTSLAHRGLPSRAPGQGQQQRPAQGRPAPRR